MGSSIARTHLYPSPSPSPPFLDNSLHASPSHIHLNPKKSISRNPPISKFSALKKSSTFPLSCVKVQHPSSVSEKVRSLGFEFRSLPQPIDRVKRLLNYAAVLPPFEESSRIRENRVLGCTTQVWLEAAMDGNGAMRFRIDSDSEITKGFCSCLIWVLDGAAAEEVLGVRSDDLAAMNVGLPSRGNSRVNAWNNVLISMQRRTKVLVEERGTRIPEVDQAPSFISLNGSCDKTQVPCEVAFHKVR